MHIKQRITYPQLWGRVVDIGDNNVINPLNSVYTERWRFASTGTGLWIKEAGFRYPPCAPKKVGDSDKGIPLP